MKNNSVKTQAWRLILLPAVSIILLLASVMTYLYISRLNDFVEERGRTIAHKISSYGEIALQSNDEKLLMAVINTSRDEPYIRAIALYDKINDKHYFGGPQFLPLINEIETNQDPYRRTIQATKLSKRFRSPILNPVNANSVGWVEVELIIAPYQKLVYKTLLVVTLTTLACLLLAGYFAIRLHKHITQPIDQMNYVIHRFTEGKLHTRINTHYAQEFSILANAINTMGDSLEKAQADMLLSIHQSTEDLQETLDTIEIQSIELDIARKDALAASRIKSEFLANTSHEIRTPLNGIIGFTNLTLKTQLNNQQRNYLQTIHDSAQNLLISINDILDFSKIESGQLILDYIPLPLRKIIEECIDMLALDAHEKNIQVITLVDHSIPLQLLGDPGRFKQIISNLLSNAIKFSQKGLVNISVELIASKDTKAEIKVTITDEGTGLTQSQKKHLFTAFSQVDTSRSREHEGTGLGLAICKGLVQRMQGSIGVDSEPNIGSTFWFIVELGVDANFAPPTEKRLSDKSILICSDNELIYNQLNNIIDPWHAKTTWITTIHDIFLTLRKNQQDDIIYDSLIININPEESKLPPALLSNIASQLEKEFSCKVIVCCTPSHQHIFENHNKEANLTFLQQPITSDRTLNSLVYTLEIQQTDKKDTLAVKPAVAVLIVDDNNANLQLAREFLSNLQTDVTLAESGKEAIEIFKHNHFDLIFMDIQMPIMDGIETTKHIRSIETDKRTPIIALTAHSINEQKTDFLIAGLDDCIRKPINETQLIHTLKRWTNTCDLTINNSPTVSNTLLGKFIHNKNCPVNIPMCISLANNKPELACDMLTMLVGNLPDDQLQINTAFTDQSYENLEVLIHRLYGSCCYSGVPHLHGCTGLLDKILQSKNYEYIGDAQTSLNNAIDKLIIWEREIDIKRLFKLS